MPFQRKTQAKDPCPGAVVFSRCRRALDVRTGGIRQPHHLFMSTPSEIQTKASLIAMLGSLTTITLATVDARGFPNAAAVYFVSDDELTLYFLSAKTTVHGANLLARPRAAATAHDEHQAWASIAGVQLTGEARPVTAFEFPRAAILYGKKFPFLNLLKSADDPAALASAMAATTIWKLVPDWIRLIDNSRGFGFKEEIRPGQSPGQ